MGVYMDFRNQVQQELSMLLPPSSAPEWLSGASAITNNIFAQSGILLPIGLYWKDGTEDMTAWTAEFDAFREQVTQGLQDLKEI
jgi:hypothetical protein